MSILARFRPDNFTLTLVGTMLFATFLPCSGAFAKTFDVATQFAIGLLFFLQGARLSRQAVFAGMAHWRLHLTISSFTYALFPLTGLLITMLFAGHAVGMIVLPVMLFHQIQLMACSVLARRYADRALEDVA